MMFAGSASVAVFLLALVGPLVNAQLVTASGAVPSPLALTPPTAPMITHITASVTSDAPAGICTLGTVPGSLHQPSCVVNCLVNPGNFNNTACGTDVLTNECVCLAGPIAAIESIASCVVSSCATSVMTSATDAAGMTSVRQILSSDLEIATSLYSSYCESVFGPSSISNAISSENSNPTATPFPSTGLGGTLSGTATGQITTGAASMSSSLTATSARVTPAASNVAAVMPGSPLDRGISGLLLVIIPAALAL